MKSGISKKEKLHVTQAEINEFLDGLHDQDCDKKNFNFIIEPGHYTRSALGPIYLNAIPFFVCEKCGAKYIAPKFDEWLEREIAQKLILSDHFLTKKEWKFLRQFLGLSQQEVGTMLGIDKFEISKFESRSYPHKNFATSKQIQLKGKYANLLFPDMRLTVKELRFLNTSEEKVSSLTEVSLDSKEIQEMYKKIA